MDWCELLRKAISDSGKSTYAIAKEAGMSHSTVNQVKLGQEPKLSTAERIAAVVGLRLSKSR